MYTVHRQTSQHQITVLDHMGGNGRVVSITGHKDMGLTPSGA